MTVFVSHFENSTLSLRQTLEDIFSSMGGLSQLVRPGHTVLIKPNLVAPFPHAVTSLKLLQAIVDKVKQCGATPVIGESAGFEFDTELTFQMLKANEFAARNQIKLINFDEDEFTSARLQNGMIRKVRIPKSVRDADFLINVPKLKRHGLTDVTIGAKNLFGLLHRDSRRKLHSFGLDRAIFELTRIINPDLTIVDGSVITDCAVYGNHRQLGLLFAGKNVFELDIYCCQFLDVHYRDVSHIRLALENGIVKKEFPVHWVGSEYLIEDSQTNPRRRISLSNILDRLGYQLMYTVDILYSWLFNKKSLIPILHYYLGIHPTLNVKICNKCGQCLSVCPVNAIHIEKGRIDSSRCMLVRCLKCVAACPESAITVRGRKVTPRLTGSTIWGEKHNEI